MRTPFLWILVFILHAACGNEGNHGTQSMEKIEVRKLSEDHWQTYTEIIIDAPSQRVWQVLTDWERIGKWSSTLKEISGDRQDKGKVQVAFLVNSNTYKTPRNFT